MNLLGGVLGLFPYAENQTIVTPRMREESETMDKVTSSDGTTIALGRSGDGPPLILS